MSDTTIQPQANMFEPADDPRLRAGREEDAPGPERITFEQGYEELKGIVARLDDPELPIHELFEGFRRGKGLEKTLRSYLQEREGELAELEEGNNLAEFEIVAPSNPQAVVGP
jgi:exodeoxyribonuclease VII small subunit